MGDWHITLDVIRAELLIAIIAILATSPLLIIGWLTGRLWRAFSKSLALELGRENDTENWDRERRRRYGRHQHRHGHHHHHRHCQRGPLGPLPLFA